MNEHIVLHELLLWVIEIIKAALFDFIAMDRHVFNMPHKKDPTSQAWDIKTAI